MLPSLLIAVAIFSAFLVVLALIAYAGYRFATKREGPVLGVAGGCALSAVLLGAAVIALIGFAIFAVLLMRHRENTFQYEQFDTPHGASQSEPPRAAQGAPSLPQSRSENKTDAAKRDDSVRQY